MSIEADVPATGHDPDFVNSTLPSWKSHKIVKAIKIARIELVEGSPIKRLLVPEMEGHAPFEVDEIFVKMNKMAPGWYYVIYNNGYKSASPAKAFEEGYVLIDASPPLDKPWPESAVRRFEEMIQGHRYGYAIGVCISSDAQYDRLLTQARSLNLREDSPLRQPTDMDPKSYDNDARTYFEIIVMDHLKKQGFLKKLDEPSAAQFSIPYFIREEAKKIFASAVITDNDIESIIELARQMHPWFYELKPGDWLGLIGSRFNNLKNALSDATIAYVTR